MVAEVQVFQTRFSIPLAVSDMSGSDNLTSHPDQLVHRGLQAFEIANSKMGTLQLLALQLFGVDGAMSWDLSVLSKV